MRTQAHDLTCAGWKGMGKASKVSHEDGGRIARWRRIADAASKQSLRYAHVDSKTNTGTVASPLTGMDKGCIS